MARDTDETVKRLLGGVPPPPPRGAAEEAPAVRAEQRRRARPAPPVGEEKQPARAWKMEQDKIPSSLFSLVKAEKEKVGATHEEWFLDAFDAVYDLLPDAYPAKSPRRSPVPMHRRRNRRPSDDPLVSYPLRLPIEAGQVLEARRDEVGAPTLANFTTMIVKLRLIQLGLIDEAGKPIAP